MASLFRQSAMVLAAAACLGNSDTADLPSVPKLPTQPSSGSTMSASVDGTPWTATYIRGNVLSSGNTFLVFGSKGAGTSTVLSVSLGFRLAIGEQTLIPPQQFGQVDERASFWSSILGGAGSVMVDSLGPHRITGSFQFSAQASGTITPVVRRITAGRFAVNY
jgi:hypothetical protein